MLFLNRIAQLPHHGVACQPKLAQQLSRRPHHLGHPLRAEQDKRHGENYDDFGYAQSLVEPLQDSVMIVLRGVNDDQNRNSR